MHLMYYLDDAGKRVYTLKVSHQSKLGIALRRIVLHSSIMVSRRMMMMEGHELDDQSPPSSLLLPLQTERSTIRRNNILSSSWYVMIRAPL